MPPDDVVPAGGAPASPEPSTPAPAPEPTSTPLTGAEFSGLGDDFDDDIEVTLPEAAGGATPPVDAAAEAKPPEPPKAPAPEVKPPEPPKPAEVKPPEGPKETPAAPATPPSEPQTLVQQLGEHRLAIMDELAKTRFRWDEGEKKQFTDDLEADASKALVDWVPKLMSRMYYESATMALNHISQFTPVLINNFTRLMEQQKTAEGDFFKQFPQLNKQQHWNDVLQFANVFGKQPGITQADLLAMVGAAVMAKNKIAMNGGNPNPPPRKPSTPPFVPAQAGGSPARVVTEPESPYAGLGGHYDDE